MNEIKQKREWMKSQFQKISSVESDQQLGLPQPPLVKSCDKDGKITKLPEVKQYILRTSNVFDVLEKRSSKRKYTNENISLEELSFLLWATQGVKKIAGNNIATLRTVPSGGARHPFETYLVVNRVEGLERGLYIYLSLTHELLFLYEIENIEEKLTEYTSKQKFIGSSAVTFIWSVIPYRTEWRYSTRAHKIMLLDAGHMCQNLYIACEAIGCGTCAIAAYNQEKIDKMLSLDGEDEFAIYLAPVGKCE